MESKNVCDNPVGQKRREDIDFMEIGHFLAQGHTLEAGGSETDAQKLLVQSWNSPENFIKIHSFHRRLFSFSRGQTDRHTLFLLF